MEFWRLGRSGLKVSEICLGTITFGDGTDAAEAERMVQAALDAGVTFFDTADGYSNGESEVMLGRALGTRRRDAVIATKVFNAMRPGPNDCGMSRVHIMNAVEDSLRRLGTDTIDLHYIHHVDVQTPLDEMLRAFDDWVRQGKIRCTACSNSEAWRLMEALWISDRKGLARFEAYQLQYSLVVRDIEEELVHLCRAWDRRVVAARGPLLSQFRTASVYPPALSRRPAASGAHSRPAEPGGCRPSG